MKKVIWATAIFAVMVIGIIVLIIAGGMFVARGGLSRAMPPLPVVVSSHTDTGGTTMTDYCRTITAEVRNDGGNGDVVVNITYKERGQEWTKSSRQSFTANETKKISMVFPEAQLGEEGRYNVSVR